MAKIEHKHAMKVNKIIIYTSRCKRAQRLVFTRGQKSLMSFFITEFFFRQFEVSKNVKKKINAKSLFFQPLQPHKAKKAKITKNKEDTSQKQNYWWNTFKIFLCKGSRDINNDNLIRPPAQHSPGLGQGGSKRA